MSKIAQIALGVIVDVIRLLKVVKNKGLSGYQDFSSYYFKHPKV